MATLIVTANPEAASLTRAVADRLAAALPDGSAEIADLAAEGFDPRWTTGDRHSYTVAGEYPDDVAAEMARVDRSDHVVLVFPVYWWSMPGLLKGWIDRVFTNGWAYGVGDGSGIRPGLGHITMHLIPIAGSDAALYERRGYDRSFETQIVAGIIDYCGMQRGATAFLYESEEAGTDVPAALDAVVAEVAAAIRG